MHIRVASWPERRLNDFLGSECERSVSSRVRQALGWIGVTMFVVAVFVLASEAQRGKLTARQIRQRLLLELEPVALQNCTVERFGGPNDGGYLMCANLLGNVQSAYSYGIGPSDEWGCAISQRYGVVVHQYDCFSPPEAACSGGQSMFHDDAQPIHLPYRHAHLVGDRVTARCRGAAILALHVLRRDVERAGLHVTGCNTDSLHAVDQLGHDGFVPVEGIAMAMAWVLTRFRCVQCLALPRCCRWRIH